MVMIFSNDAIDATVSVVQSKRMNTRWFRRQLQDKHLSQRGLAKLLSTRNQSEKKKIIFNRIYLNEQSNDISKEENKSIKVIKQLDYSF